VWPVGPVPTTVSYSSEHRPNKKLSLISCLYQSFILISNGWKYKSKAKLTRAEKKKLAEKEAVKEAGLAREQGGKESSQGSQAANMPSTQQEAINPNQLKKGKNQLKRKPYQLKRKQDQLKRKPSQLK
jgi:hypothetical protein